MKRNYRFQSVSYYTNPNLPDAFCASVVLTSADKNCQETVVIRDLPGSLTREEVVQRCHKVVIEFVEPQPAKPEKK